MNYEDVLKEIIENQESEFDSVVLDELNKFPYELFEIKFLETLYLDNWLLDFDVKEKDFDKLTDLKNLKSLSLFGNGLDFVPRQISELENLESLVIFGNNIKKIPYEITKCTKLRELEIGSNEIEEIPEFILGLKNLECLNIGGNPIKAIPRRIDYLSNLKTLLIGDTKIKNLPVELLKLRLEEFNAGNSLIEIRINDGDEWSPIEGQAYVKNRLEYYFEEYRIQLKKKLKNWLANNQTNKVLEILTSEIPELSYYDVPKDIILASSRFKHIELERRRGRISFEQEKLELNNVIMSLIEIVEEL